MPKRNTHGWTVDTLHEHLCQVATDAQRHNEAKFTAQEHSLETAITLQKERTQMALDSAALAVQKAETANDKRFDAANAVKEAFGLQMSSFMPRAECDVKISALSDKIVELAKFENNASGRRTGISGTTATILVVVGLLIDVVIAVLMAHGSPVAVPK